MTVKIEKGLKMNLAKALFVTPLTAISVALALSASAANHFVSKDGAWKMKDESGQEMEGKCWTNLQEAIEGAARSGDTIYVKNGFVVDAEPAVATGYNACRLLNSKTLDVIAEGRDWKTGPKVMGRHADTEAGYGEGALRCVYQNTYASAAGVWRFVGFNFIDGATTGTGTANQDSGVGGCLRGNSAKKLILEKCRIVGGVAGGYGGGVKGATLTDCVVTNCAARNLGGGAYASDLYDSLVVSNRTIQTSSNSQGGGGIYEGSATRTCFYGNVVEGSAGGGAAASATLVSCVVSNNASGRYGGGAWKCTTENCIFVDNVQGPNGSVGAGGGGVCGGTHYNALILRNTADNQGGAAYEGVFYNCTAYANTNTHYKDANNVGGFQGCTLVNCISYGNVGGGDSASATNSCVQVKTLSDKYVDCINTDPKLDADLRPHAQACRKAGLVFNWMTDEADVRARDLAGNPRIAPGKEKPDMGCYETPFKGLMMIVR